MNFTQHLRIAVVLGVTLLGAGVGQTARADETLATSESYKYTQEMVNADLSQTEWRAHHSLTPEERRQITAIDIAQFRRNPKLIVQDAHNEAVELLRVSKLSLAFQQQVRYTALWSIFQAYKTNALCTAEEDAAYKQIYRRYTQPVFVAVPQAYGPDETAMILAEDVQAGWEAIQFFADKLGVSAPSREQYRDLIKEVCTKRCEVGSPGRSFLLYMGNMQSRWLAMQADTATSKDGGASAPELKHVPANKRNDPVQLALAVPPAFDNTLELYAVQFDSDGKLFPANVQIMRFNQMMANRWAFLNAALRVSQKVR